MVFAVAVHPYYRNICINNLDKNECKIIRSNITVMPWEVKKLNDYISEIIQLTEKSIDFFYIILDDTFLNNFRKKIVEICKIHNFIHYEIINDYKADAIIALEFMKNHSSNGLWIFNCFHRGICCSIWEKNADSGFFLLEHCRQNRTTHGDNPSINELTNLKYDIEVAIPKKSLFPVLVIIQREKQFDEMCYKTAFNDYQNIFFYKQKSFAYSFVRHIQNLFKYNINDIFGRDIDFKINEILIANFIANSKMPFMNEYEINVIQSNTIFKVYEKNLLTQEIPLKEKGKINVNIVINENGIYNVEIKRKITIWDPFPFSDKINFEIENQIFNIPSKLPIYNTKLNAVGIDLGTFSAGIYF